ncbi:MAG: methyltransferase [Bryobacterales bacterium]|nr:methyltransferase [Bryobacterales bacterium]
MARFGIADHLEAGPKSPKELASLTGTNEQALYRVLRAAASLGVTTELEDGRFAQTPLSDPLRSNAKPGIRNFAMMFLDEWHMRTWTELPWSVQTGRPAPYKVYGMGGFEWLSQNPDQAVNFNNAMTDLSQDQAPAIAQAYDFSQFQSVVDIAGGLGTLLAAILERAPKLRGVLFEMPYLIGQAHNSAILQSFRDRCDFIGGNFFESVPAGADAYIMKFIIHDWDDEQATKILANCRKGIRPSGKLLVVDQVVPPRNEPGLAKLMDLEMLVAPGGRERTGPEWKELFAASGFRLERIIPTPAPQCILEGVPV